MHHRHRIAPRGEVDEDPPGAEPAQREKPVGDRIVPLKVEEEPAVRPAFGEGGGEGLAGPVVERFHSYPSGKAPRQTQSSSPRARQRSWIMAPSKPLAKRSSSAITAL